MTHKLEPDSKQIRQMLDYTTEKIITYLDNIAKPVSFDLSEARAKANQSSEALHEVAESFEDLLDDLFAEKIPQSLNATQPGFMAYIPGGGLFYSALAELIAKVANRYVGIDATAPFLVQIESDVLRWFCKMVGYSAESGGTLTSGGSIANLTAVICARSYLLGDDFSKATVYASEFTHHSNWKAFLAAGINSKQIRNIPVDSQFRIDIEQLDKAMADDKNNGFKPLMVIASAGSTNTGTVDQLQDIARITSKYNAWFHVDAAYGGFFSMIDSGKKILKGIELSDSITLDPHKGLFLPYGTGAFIIRDRNILKKVFMHTTDYLPEQQDNLELWNFSDMSLELTRPFRGLSIWLPFKMLGADTFRETLQEKLDLAQYFHQCLCENSNWEIICAPELSLTSFRYVNSNCNETEINALNNEILNTVNSKFRVNISGTIINEKFVIRCCILSFRTHKEHIDWLLEDLDDAVQSVLSKKLL